MKPTYLGTRVSRCLTCREWFEVVSIFDFLKSCIISCETINADWQTYLNFGSVPLIKSEHNVCSNEKQDSSWQFFWKESSIIFLSFRICLRIGVTTFSKHFSRDSLLTTVFTMSLTSSEKHNITFLLTMWFFSLFKWGNVAGITDATRFEKVFVDLF